MIRFSISTSQPYASIAIELENGEVREKSFKKSHQPVCETVIIHIDNLLKENDVSKQSICQIGVDSGPGSFTGLRIGIATANAMGLALNIPVSGFSSLDILAEQHRNHNTILKEFVKVGINARRNQIFSACYQHKNNEWVKIKNDCLETKEEFICDSGNYDIIGYELDKTGINSTEILLDASTIFSLMHAVPSAQKRYFASPNYIRLSDAQVNKSQNS